jgi:hypothetical protein
MPVISISAVSQCDTEMLRNRVCKCTVPTFRIHPQITSCAISLGDPGAYLQGVHGRDGIISPQTLSIIQLEPYSLRGSAVL